LQFGSNSTEITVARKTITTISSDNESSPMKIATTDEDDEVSDKINVYDNNNHPRDTIVLRGQQCQQHHYPFLSDKSNMPMIMEETRFLDVEIDVDIVKTKVIEKYIDNDREDFEMEEEGGEEVEEVKSTTKKGEPRSKLDGNSKSIMKKSKSAAIRATTKRLFKTLNLKKNCRRQR